MHHFPSRRDPIGAALEYRRLRTAGMIAKEAADELGITRRHARRLTQLLALPQVLLDAVQTGKLSAAAGLALLELSNQGIAAIVRRVDGGEDIQAVLVEYQPPKRHSSRPVPRAGAEQVRRQLGAMIRLFHSGCLDQFFQDIENRYGPSDPIYRMVNAARDAATGLKCKFGESVDHVHALVRSDFRRKL